MRPKYPTNRWRHLAKVLALLFTHQLINGCGSREPIGENTGIYYISYYYQEEPLDTLITVGTQRQVGLDKFFCILNYEHHNLKPYFQSCYDPLGNPLKSGMGDNEERIWNDRLDLNFRGRDTTIYVNTKVLIDPTKLWFWRSKPKVNDSLIAKGFRKNFITNSIDITATIYQYLGERSIEVLGEVRTTHLVKSWSQNRIDQSHDLRWFLDNGMMVREEHHVGSSPPRIGVVTKVVGE